MFQEAEGEGLPQLNFTGIFTGRKVSMLKKDGFFYQNMLPWAICPQLSGFHHPCDIPKTWQ